MADPLTSPLTAKAVAGIGGLIGGALFMVFMRPKNVWDAAIRSSVSTTTAILGYPIVLEYLGWQYSTDHCLAISAVIGFCAWSILSAAAHFLMNVEHEKIEVKLPGVTINKQ